DAVAVEAAGLQEEERRQDHQRAGQADPVEPCEVHARFSRCRTASNRATPVATETLRLSKPPGIGIFARLSQCSRVRWRMPLPSPPSTSATLPVRSSAYSEASASPSRPWIQTPCFCRSRSRRARLVARTTGTVSAAPAEVLRTVALTCTALSLGITTAVAPAAAALRR